jgi:rhodanese-related sulfurtransferase
MTRIFVVIFSLLFAANISFGKDLIPVTAEQAYDAQVKQIDPISQKTNRVAIVDIRTAAEYYWVGACAKVDLIVTNDGKEIQPYLGKVFLDRQKDVLSFKIKDNNNDIASLQTDEVKELFTDPISINIPFENWDETSKELIPNNNFKKEMEALSKNYDVLIVICRSGKRSSKCDFDFSLFKAVYEVDQPTGKNGRGGFQGTSYSEAFNGYRGFPGRNTVDGDNHSVSWNDAGLPIHIGWGKKM